MSKKIISLVLSLLAFPSYSKNILPNVQGSIRVEDTELIFVVERVLFSYPFYITGYEITFEDYMSIQKCTSLYYLPI